MFDFTKEVVINSKNFEVIPAHDQFDAKLRVHGGGEYFGKNVVETVAYETDPVEGKVFELSITPVVVDKGDVQYHLQFGLDRGDARGDWGSAMFYFKKPMLVTVAHDATVDTIVKAMNIAGSSYGVFAKENGGSVVLTSNDNVIKLRDCKAYSIDGDNVSAVNVEYTYTPNAVEFGTYNYLLHNLRMPTYENYRYTSPAAIEMPVAGSKYHQFAFLYCVARPGLGGLSVAGQTNHSTTTHTFFVDSNLADDFRSALEEIGVSVKKVDTNGASTEEASHNVDILPDANATVDMVDGE